MGAKRYDPRTQVHLAHRCGVLSRCGCGQGYARPTIFVGSVGPSKSKTVSSRSSNLPVVFQQIRGPATNGRTRLAQVLELPIASNDQGCSLAGPNVRLACPGLLTNPTHDLRYMLHARMSWDQYHHLPNRVSLSLIMTTFASLIVTHGMLSDRVEPSNYENAQTFSYGIVLTDKVQTGEGSRQHIILLLVILKFSRMQSSYTLMMMT